MFFNTPRAVRRHLVQPRYLPVGDHLSAGTTGSPHVGAVIRRTAERVAATLSRIATRDQQVAASRVWPNLT